MLFANIKCSRMLSMQQYVFNSRKIIHETLAITL